MDDRTSIERAEMERATNDSDGELTTESRSRQPWLRMLGEKRALWRQIQASDCLGCQGHSSAIAMACPIRGAGPDAEGAAALCKWHEEFERDNAIAERLAARRERLLSAGFTDQHVIDLIVATSDPPRPKRYESPEFRSMWSAVMMFLREPSRLCLTLYGNPGVGKSLACAFIIAQIRGSFLIRPRATIQPNDNWNQPRVAALNTPLLVLEDLGWESKSSWHVGEVQGLIMARADAGRRTIISTNLRPGDHDDPESLCGRYGPAAWSRLRAETRGNLMIYCGSTDLRRGET